MSRQKEIINRLIKSVVNYQIEECRDLAVKTLEEGIDPIFTVMEGLAKGMEKAGSLYDTNIYFVPEVLMSAETFYAGFEILHPHMIKDPAKEKGSLLIGTVPGDPHDIGKNLVKTMFATAGWKVHDLGFDVPLEKYVEKQREVKADILALSAMMTTTMMGIKKIIPMVRAENLSCQILIGGAPVSRDIAYLFGADGYASSAGEAVSEAVKMIARFNAERSAK